MDNTPITFSKRLPASANETDQPMLRVRASSAQSLSFDGRFSESRRAIGMDHTGTEINPLSRNTEATYGL
jgi:hypothetical protein